MLHVDGTFLEICHAQHNPFRFELPNQVANSQKSQFISHLVRNSNGPYIAHNTSQSHEKKIQDARTCVMRNKPITFHFSISQKAEQRGHEKMAPEQWSLPLVLPASTLLAYKTLHACALQVLPCEGPDLGIKMGGCDARARQVKWVEEYLHNSKQT